eukprot:13815042-Alexandrium_andersonii.AAC.1
MARTGSRPHTTPPITARMMSGARHVGRQTPAASATRTRRVSLADRGGAEFAEYANWSRAR